MAHEHEGCPHEHEGEVCPLGVDSGPDVEAIEAAAEAAVEIAEIQAEVAHHEIDASVEHHEIDADAREDEAQADDELIEAVEELAEAVEELEEAQEPEVVLVPDAEHEDEGGHVHVDAEDVTEEELESEEGGEVEGPAGDEPVAVAPPPRVEPVKKSAGRRRSRFTARHSR